VEVSSELLVEVSLELLMEVSSGLLEVDSSDDWLSSTSSVRGLSIPFGPVFHGGCSPPGHTKLSRGACSRTLATDL
jgi:hypothetical protein